MDCMMELSRDPKKDDYVLVEFEVDKTKIYYVGKIIEELDENDEYKILFYRKSEKFLNRFNLPIVPDVSHTSKLNIKKILPQPIQQRNTTKRQQCYLYFGISFGNLRIK